MTHENLKTSDKELVYTAPSASTISVLAEGILCESGIGIKDWEKDDELLDFD